jgi:hypothetical protein
MEKDARGWRAHLTLGQVLGSLVEEAGIVIEEN